MQVPSLPAKAEQLLDLRLLSLGGVFVTPGTLIVVAAIVVAAILLARLTRSAVDRSLARRQSFDPVTARVIGQLAHYVVLIIGLGIALDTLGVNLGALFAAGAFLAVAAGLALQSIAQNLVSGVILLFERTIKPGDVLEVDGRVVRVSQMGFRATVARTRDEEDLIIPNSILATQVVTNYTLVDSTFRVRSTVDVAYDSDLDLVKATLYAAAGRMEERLPTPEPRVLLVSFGNSGVTFEVSVWVKDPWLGVVSRSHLNEEIWRSLRAAGVTIPFPQMDVHFDPTRPPPRDAAQRPGASPR